MNADESSMDERSIAKRQERLAVEAAEWVAREAHTNPAEREEFNQWLSQSPAHVKEFLLASSWNNTLPHDLAECRIDTDRLLSGSNVIHVQGRTAPIVRSRFHGSRWSRIALIGFGAAAAAAVALVTLPFVRDFWPANVYATSVGEQRTVALPDGSIIAMNTQSRIRVDYSALARTVYLTAGQAMFDVSNDAERPFRVNVDGGAVVQAIGTKFDIRRTADSTTVAVIEGRVQITPASEKSLSAMAERTRLAAGEAVSISDRGGMTPPATIDFAEISAWQQRRLVFRDDTLRDIVDEFHRYNRTKIRIEGEELARRRYSGVWDADRPEILLTYLSSHGNVRIDREGDGLVLRPLSTSSATN